MRTIQLRMVPEGVDDLPLDLTIQTGTAPLKVILDLALSFDKLYRAHGGAHLRTATRAVNRKQIPQHDYLSRREVYEAIEMHSLEANQRNIVQATDKRFPEQEFGEEIPFAQALDYLFNQLKRFG